MDADVIGVKWTPSNSTEGADFDECDDNGVFAADTPYNPGIVGAI
jgi:hypothetical protein